MKDFSEGLFNREQQPTLSRAYAYVLTSPGTTTKYLTNINTPFTLPGVGTFTPAGIKHGQISQNIDNSVTIAMGVGRTVELYKSLLFNYAGKLIITIYLVNFGKLEEQQIQDVTPEKYQLFRGVLKRSSYSEGSLSLEFVDEFNTDKSKVAKNLYQRTCAHELYGDYCKVNKATYKSTRTILAIDNANRLVDVTGSESENNYYGLGTLEKVATSDGASILSSTTATGSIHRLRLSYIPATLQVGDSVDLYPGCDKTIRTCIARFNNLANNLSFPFTPVKRNPTLDGGDRA